MKFKPSDDDTIEGILKLKKLFRGDLLEGCYFNKCDEFNDFIIYERINFEQRKVKILKRLVELYENYNRYDECIEAINEILETEPYDEDMVIKLLDFYAKSGKRVAAITYFNNFSNRLACSLGIPPSNELRNKYNEIRLSMSDCRSEADIGYDHKLDAKYKQRCNEIKIISNCMKNIDYFWIADVVGKIADIADEDTINNLNLKELLDLGHIQSKMLKFVHELLDHEGEHKREVMSVCIINAFVKLIECFCRMHSVTIVILNSRHLDEISTNVLEYLKRIDIQGLSFIEE